MTLKKNRLWILFTIVAIVFLGGGWWTFSRLGSNRGSQAPSANSTDPSDSTLFTAAPVAYEVNPTEESLPAVLDQMIDQTRSLFGELPAQDSIRLGQIDGFVRLLRDRFELLLKPDFDAWVRQSEQYGAHPSGPAGPKFTLAIYYSANPNPKFRTMWERVANSTRLTPLSIEGMRIRPQRVRGTDIEQPRSRRTFGPMFVGGAVDSDEINSEKMNPRYTDVYEVIVPMLFQQTRALEGETDDGIQNIRAHLGIWLAWDASTTRWIPYRLIGYDNGEDSAGIVPPVF